LCGKVCRGIVLLADDKSARFELVAVTDSLHQLYQIARLVARAIEADKCSAKTAYRKRRGVTITVEWTKTYKVILCLVVNVYSGCKEDVFDLLAGVLSGIIFPAPVIPSS